MISMQISFSTFCGAQCRFCLSQHLKRVHNFKEKLHMDLDLVKKVLGYKYDQVVICSNRGEALYHPEIDTILELSKESGSRVSFVTNASLKDVQWWRGLAQKFDRGDSVTFPLDGIGNKIHQQHRKTDFYTVLRNMEAFTNAGGRAIWQFIIFKHNEHQQDMAKRLAFSLGINIQFRNSHTYDDVLEVPVGNRVWNTDAIHKETINEDDLSKMQCQNGLYYTSVKGYVFPCCFIGNVFAHEPYLNHYFKRHNKDLVRLYKQTKESLNLNNSNLEDILNSKFFRECRKMRSYICVDSCLRFIRNKK